MKNNILKQAVKEAEKMSSGKIVGTASKKPNYDTNVDNGNPFISMAINAGPTIIKNLPKKYKAIIALVIWIFLSGIFQNIDWIISLF